MSESAPTFKWVAVEKSPDDPDFVIMCILCAGPQDGAPFCMCEMARRRLVMVRMEDHPRRPPLDQIEALGGVWDDPPPS